MLVAFTAVSSYGEAAHGVELSVGSRERHQEVHSLAGVICNKSDQFSLTHGQFGTGRFPES